MTPASTAMCTRPTRKGINSAKTAATIPLCTRICHISAVTFPQHMEGPWIVSAYINYMECQQKCRVGLTHPQAGCIQTGTSSPISEANAELQSKCDISRVSAMGSSIEHNAGKTLPLELCTWTQWGLYLNKIWAQLFLRNTKSHWNKKY